MLGQKSVKNLGRFLGNGVSRKNTFEISWPLLEKIDGSRVGKQTIDGNSRRILLSLPYS